MKPVQQGLEARLPGRLTELFFDYAAASYHWAAVPAIASCLADYLNTVSASYRAAGGDGKVIVVAHSMGGLATRFATDGAFAQHPVPATGLAGLVTIDTPHQGSPWGNTTLARRLELIAGRQLASQMFAKSGTDGSICLAVHNYKTGLPSGCPLPPYLPTTVPVDEIAGDISISRFLFGIHMYDIGLLGDAVVPAGSSRGYPGSGPGGVMPAGTKVTAQSASCSQGLDKLVDAAVRAGIASRSGALASLGAAFSTLGNSSDNAAIDQILSDKYGDETILLFAAGYFGSPCSHSHVLSFPVALDKVAQSVKAHLGTPVATPAQAMSALRAIGEKTCLHYANNPNNNGKCGGIVQTAISKVDPRYGFAGPGAHGYSGSLYRRTNSSSLDWRLVFSRGGGMDECHAFSDFGVPLRVLQDLDVCFSAAPASISQFVGQWATHAGALVVSSDGTGTADYPREDPRTFTNNFYKVSIKITSTYGDSASGVYATGRATNSDDPGVANGSKVNLVRTTSGVDLQLGSFKVAYCDQGHYHAGACGA